MAHEAAPWVESSRPADLLHPVSDEDWAEIAQAYGDGQPLQRLLAVARESGCRSVVVEHRYIDLDYRSEHSNFWSLRFEVPSPFARRLHFFSRALREDELHRLPDDCGYLGYTVLRPMQRGRVGRTVLAPPPRLNGAVLTMVDDTVSLFGNDLKVRGVPFCEQDGEYLRCAHAAAWVCHYVAVRRDLVGQRSTSHIVSFIPPSEERAIPSKGLRIYQLQAVFGELGQPALLYSFDDLPDVNGVQRPAPEIDPKTKRQRFPGYWDTRAISIICRYLNSGFPVLVAAAGHAIALVGWYRKDGSLRFIACDDQVGPYEEIESPFSHYKAPWHGIMVPLPPKVFLTGEAAENAGFNTLRAIWASNSASVPLADALDDQRIQLRARLKNVRAFKREVAEQTSSEEVLRAVRLARLPHFVWVVEAHLRHACGSGPCVLGTVLFDATSSDYEPRICMIAAPGVVAAFSPDGAAPDIVRGSHAPWHSMLSAH